MTTIATDIRSRWSVGRIERAYGDGIITGDEALEALTAKRQAIEADPKNSLPKGSSIYIYTPAARTRLDEIAWAITRTLTAEKRKERS